MTKAVSAVLVIVLVLLAVRWLVRRSEAHLAFFPTRGEDVTPASFGLPFTPLDATTADGETIRVWHLSTAHPRAQVVYFHGNGGNLSLWCEVLVALASRGFDVVAFDYRGYGMSTGVPTERGLYEDVKAVVQLATGPLRASATPLVYWGRSLGTTMAAYGTTVREPDGVILEAGFPSLQSVVASNPIVAVLSWFSSYEFPTARWLAQTRAPALVVHGNADSVIPYRLGEQLYAQLPGRKRFVTIVGGDHNDLTPPDPAAYWQAIDQFIATLAIPAP